MIQILLTLFLVIVGIFLLLAVLSAGILMKLFGGMFGRARSRPDAQMLAALSGLSPGERALLADSVRRQEQSIGILSDEASLQSLIAKNIVVQTEGHMGVIYYRIDDTVWAALRR